MVHQQQVRCRLKGVSFPTCAYHSQETLGHAEDSVAFSEDICPPRNALLLWLHAYVRAVDNAALVQSKCRLVSCPR